MPVKINFTCDYNDFGEFLTMLGYATRLINCYDLQMSASNGNLKGSVNITAMMKSFVSTKEKEGGAPAVSGVTEKDVAEHSIVPLFRYAKYMVKDPFKPLTTKEILVASDEVNVAALRLSAIIALGKTDVAMFEDEGKVPYYLVNGKFYNKNRTLVPDVEGSVEKGKVMLKQTDKVSGASKTVSYEIAQ